MLDLKYLFLLLLVLSEGNTCVLESQRVVSVVYYLMLLWDHFPCHRRT